MSGRQQSNCIIRNSTVIDGTGAPRFGADIAIAGDRIAAVGGSSLRAKGAREIDARGMIVAPGFIDAHAHDDLALLSMPDMTPKISQGVTTVVAGNCGISLAPLAMPGVPPPPLDLLGNEPGWFRFGRFRTSWTRCVIVRPRSIAVCSSVTSRCGTASWTGSTALRLPPKSRKCGARYRRR